MAAAKRSAVPKTATILLIALGSAFFFSHIGAAAQRNVEKRENSLPPSISIERTEDDVAPAPQRKLSLDETLTWAVVTAIDDKGQFIAGPKSLLLKSRDWCSDAKEKVAAILPEAQGLMSTGGDMQLYVMGKEWRISPFSSFMSSNFAGYSSSGQEIEVLAIITGGTYTKRRGGKKNTKSKGTQTETRTTTTTTRHPVTNNNNNNYHHQHRGGPPPARQTTTVVTTTVTNAPQQHQGKGGGAAAVDAAEWQHDPRGPPNVNPYGTPPHYNDAGDAVDPISWTPLPNRYHVYRWTNKRDGSPRLCVSFVTKQKLLQQENLFHPIRGVLFKESDFVKIKQKNPKKPKNVRTTTTTTTTYYTGNHPPPPYPGH